MGLDICNDGSNNLVENLLYGSYELNDPENLRDEAYAIAEAGDYATLKQMFYDSSIYADHIDGESLEGDIKGYVDREVSLFEAMKKPLLIEPDTSGYEYILEDEECQDSRMGSYSTIHSLRSLADCMAATKFAGSLGMFANLTLTEEDMLKAVDLGIKNYTNYDSIPFDNLCGHSDCDGYYVPTETRLDFDHGSSIGLFHELDAINKSGLVKLMQDFLQRYKREEVSFLDEETRNRYYFIDKAYWVWKKLMYHAILSIQYREIITFC